MNAAAILARLEPDPDSACLLWPGSANSDGYGTVRPPRTPCFGDWPEVAYVHRVVFRLVRGPFDLSLTLDHFECHRGLCGNAYHLRPLTREDHAIASNHYRWHELRPAQELEF